MEVIPAMDLMGSKVVRLRRGMKSDCIEYNPEWNIVEIAGRWIDEGATTLHIVDLDRAFGSGNNLTQIREVMDAYQVPLQIGGGLRSAEDIIEMLEFPLTSVMIGTLAMQDPDTLRQLAFDYGTERIIVALDYRGNYVLQKGWTESTGMRVAESIDNFLNLDISRFLLTSADRDGMLCGPDCETLQALSTKEGIEIIAAGGISSIDDLRKLKDIGVAAVIVGKALYEGVFVLREVAVTLRRGPD